MALLTFTNICPPGHTTKPPAYRTLNIRWTSDVLECTYVLATYSSLPNNCVGWNKRVGMKFLPKIINV